MKVRCKDISILVDGPVLDYCLFRFFYLEYLAESRIKEVDLQVEGPSLHILIKIIQVRIVIDIFIMWSPSVLFCKEPCKGCFAGTYIAGYCYVHGQVFKGDKNTIF